MKERLFSVCIGVLALAAFQPFGLPLFGWMRIFHLIGLGVSAAIACGISELVLKVLGLGRSMDHGVKYIIRRNLAFQFMNTPLLALFLCLYRRFFLDTPDYDNSLSWANYLETLVFMAFCSFVIGLYWRGHFRSLFLAKQLEETMRLNAILEERQRMADEHMKHCHDLEGDDKSQEKILLSGSTKESLELALNDFLYSEALGNYVKIVYVDEGKTQQQMLRTTIKQLADDLSAYSDFQRCHRAFIVNMNQIDHVENQNTSFLLIMKHCLTGIPVSKSYVNQIKEIIRNPGKQKC